MKRNKRAFGFFYSFFFKRTTKDDGDKLFLSLSFSPETSPPFRFSCVHNRLQGRDRHDRVAADDLSQFFCFKSKGKEKAEGKE